MSFKPIPFTQKAGTPAADRLAKYLEERTKALREGLTRLHGMDGIIKWRKAYEAEPAEEVREFPFHNASNLVVPVVAIHSDTLLARVMSAVIKTAPLWVVRELGNFVGKADPELRGALEEFLGYVGLEPSELDLYRVYHEWFGEAITLGTAVLKCPWVKNVEDMYGPASDMSGRNEWYAKTIYEGPRPEKLKFENFMCPVNKGRIEDMDFKYDVVQLSRYDIEERKFRKQYDALATQYVLKQPDRTSRVGQVQSQKEKDALVRTTPGAPNYEEWDICEIHCKYRVDTEHFARLMIIYHEKSKQILRSYYHYYPDEVYIAARLFFRDDMFHGMGFSEILLPFQEEVSEIHNGRRDNMTVCNTKLWAVDPDSKLHKGFRTYPGAMLPAKQQQGNPEISPLEFGTPVQGETDSERLTLELAEKRSGVSPPMQGSGAGTNTKRGVYTAMGTLSLLQEGNTRTDLNITDIRYAHTRLGRLLCREYGAFGASESLLNKFGESGAKIKDALEAIADGKMALPVYASTASVNREVEKQSDLMLTGVTDKYHQTITQMLQAVNNPLTPEPIKKYVNEAMEASRNLMKTVYRHFNYDEVDRMVPKIPPPEPIKPPQGQPPQGGSLQTQLGPGMVPPSVIPGGGGGGSIQ